MDDTYIKDGGKDCNLYAKNLTESWDSDESEQAPLALIIHPCKFNCKVILSIFFSFQINIYISQNNLLWEYLLQSQSSYFGWGI